MFSHLSTRLVARVQAVLCGALFAGAAVADLAPDRALCTTDASTMTGTFESVFRDAAPAVVRVLSLRHRLPGETDEPESLFLPLSNGSTAGKTVIPELAAASGFIVSPDGLVLGSAHGVRRAAEIWVELHNGQQLRARLVGVDARLDLALLKIEGNNLPVLSVAADDARPGQWVASLGAPFGFERSISAGVVSAFPRELPEISEVGLIQSDVAMNPGSSGGPLLNACGQVIGMSVMIFSSHGLYIGITFAVPGRRLLQAAAALMNGGSRLSNSGVRLQSLTAGLANAFGTPGAAGALIVQVQSAGAAREAGLKEGDIVLALDGLPTVNADAVEERLAALAPGQRVWVEIWRDGANRRIELRLRPASLPPSERYPAGAALPRLGLLLGESPTRSSAGSQDLRVLGTDGASMLAGIEEGDRITAVNGRRVSTLHEFDQALLTARVAGARAVALLVLRGTVPTYLPVRMGDGAQASER